MYSLKLSSEQIDNITVEGLGDFYVNTLDMSFPYPQDEDIDVLMTLEKTLTYFVPTSEYDIHIKYLRNQAKPNNELIAAYLG